MPDPDLEIRVRVSNFFSALQASVWCTNKGGVGWGGGPSGPSPGSATGQVFDGDQT